MMSEACLSGRIGSRWRLSLEWDVRVDLQRPWLNSADVENERVELVLTMPWYKWLGSMWLWVDGNLVGDPVQIEEIGVGLEHLSKFSDGTGSRSSRLIPSLSGRAALDLVLRSVYGEDAETITMKHGDLSRHELMPGGCPFFDNWQAIMYETEACEVLIWRKDGDDDVRIAQWPIGELKRTVVEALEYFRRHLSSH